MWLAVTFVQQIQNRKKKKNVTVWALTVKLFANCCNYEKRKPSFTNLFPSFKSQVRVLFFMHIFLALSLVYEYDSRSGATFMMGSTSNPGRIRTPVDEEGQQCKAAKVRRHYYWIKQAKPSLIKRLPQFLFSKCQLVWRARRWEINEKMFFTCSSLLLLFIIWILMSWSRN